MQFGALKWIVIEACASRWAFGLIAFGLPLYALQMGMSDVTIGLLMSFHFIFELILKPWIGGLADRYGLRRVLTGSLLVRSTVPLILAAASGPFGLFFARGIHGASESMREPTMSSLLVTLDAKKAIKTFSHYNTARMLSGALGKASAGYVLAFTNFNYSWLFIIAFATSMISVISATKLTTLLKANSVTSSTEHIKEEDISPVNSYNPIMLYGYLGGVSASILNLLLPLFAVKYAGLTVAEVGSLYILAATAVLLSNFIITKFHHRLEGSKLLSIRASSSLLSSILYGIAAGIVVFSLAVAIDEFGKLAFKAGWGGLLADASNNQPHRRTMIAAQFGVVENLAEVTGPIIGGFMLGLGGPLVLLSGRALFVVLSELVLSKSKVKEGKY